MVFSLFFRPSVMEILILPHDSFLAFDQGVRSGAAIGGEACVRGKPDLRNFPLAESSGRN
jgi:hypothetical protein